MFLIVDIARQKNPVEPKDVVKNWLRSKNTLEYLGLWEQLNNPHFKGVEFDSLLKLEVDNGRALHGWEIRGFVPSFQGYLIHIQLVPISTGTAMSV